MSLDDTQKRVQEHLKNKCRVSSMTVPQEWIDGCIAFYRNSHSNTNLSDLLEFVAQQWFLMDFISLELKSLPINLNKSILVNLTGNYVLQLMSVLNIGQSAYSQHTKITKGLESNSEVSADKKIPSKWEPKNRRMLLLDLTDGSQSIQAMEYTPIHHLHLDLIPGTKVLVKGPVECRRGVILLRSNNIELLGGEVSDLVQKNAPENILARLLDKPENPNPVYGSYTAQTLATVNDFEQDGDDEPSSAKCGNNTKQQQRGVCRNNSASANQGTSSVAKQKRNDDDDDLKPWSASYPPAKKIQQRAIRAKDEEDMFPDDDDDYIFHTASAGDEDVFPDDDDDILFTDGNLAVPMEQSEEDVGRRVKISGPLTTSTTAGQAKPIIVNRPFTYLSSYIKTRADRAVNNVKCEEESICVKGFVATIKSKLEAARTETGTIQWKLSAIINDGSAALLVDFGPDVLENLIGYSPPALKSMMAASGGDSKRIGAQVLEEAKQKLIRLNCLLHIRWPASDADRDKCSAVGIPATNHKLPVVYRLEDIERRHLEMLQLL
ncbi:recQ-mediated genome instability protein 1 [Daphnia magna]|uniref:recQ-mediated genome instability protein 1 n=1 Tax=Daphnia magna TaxID=35525 RepID=UPI00140370DB|nr:recQ-mediated genome instability protein 1 [Daphnia magna]